MKRISASESVADGLEQRGAERHVERAETRRSERGAEREEDRPPAGMPLRSTSPESSEAITITAPISASASTSGLTTGSIGSATVLPNLSIGAPMRGPALATDRALALAMLSGSLCARSRSGVALAP